MNLEDVKVSQPGRTGPKRVGRGPGSGHGKTCGRGTKGYHSRTGSTGKILYEGGQMPLYRRLPKKGFTNARFRTPTAIINVGELNRFPDGTEVNLATLQKEGLRSRKYRHLKVLGDGELKRRLVVTAHRFSAAAKQKIEAAGGEARLVDG